VTYKLMLHSHTRSEHSLNYRAHVKSVHSHNGMKKWYAKSPGVRSRIIPVRLLTENEAGDNNSRSRDRNIERRSIALRRLGTALFCLICVGVMPFGQETLAQSDPRAVAENEVFSTRHTGGVSGRVVVTGRYEKPKPLPVFKNRSFCGAQVPNESLLVGRENGLRNAVLTLHPLDRQVSVLPMQLVLDNRQCAFAPHVQVAPVGSELLLKNSDPILHTVHARLGRDTLFNVGLPNWRRVTKRLERVGIVRIDCDVLHTWMSGAIVVSDTPFFAVTDGSGRFNLGDLPAGGYGMEVWHERLGAKSMKLIVSAGMSHSVDVVYSLK
jgi:plastocyanin